MKRIFLLLVVLSLSSGVWAQQVKDDFTTMVDSAVNIMYKADDAARENLYLLNEQNQPLTGLRSSGKFKLINIYDDRNHKKMTEGIDAWKVLTVLNQNRFTVTLIKYHITYKNRNYNFVNMGGATTVFEYECDRNNWRLVSSKVNGL